MNVMIFNKYKDLLLSLNLEVMKSMEGVFNVDEIVDTFSNFYYDKMILDITAIRDYQNVDNLQKLAMNINMENVILLLDDSPQSESKTYLSKLISLGIYNFTRNTEGLNYLLVHPNTYKDVVNIHDVESISNPNEAESSGDITIITNARMRVIGFKNVTAHAGATSLIYMLKNIMSEKYNVGCIEVNKVDFLYFNDKNMVSTTALELPKEIMKKQECDVVLVDLNDYDDVKVCSTVIYLLEPSTLMLSKLLRKRKNIFEVLKNEKVVLNKCVLSKNDVSTFEFESNIKSFAVIEPCDDRSKKIESISNFIKKLGL